MTNDDKALVELMRSQIESWEFEDPRSSWWKWQHQYAEAADRIEALSAKVEWLREALDWMEYTEPGVVDAIRMRVARAALGEQQ